MKKIWIDYMAPCDVFFFKSIFTELTSRFSFCNTARQHAETESLLHDYDISVHIVGTHNVQNSLSQIISFSKRNLMLFGQLPNFDASLSLANIYAVIVSKLRGRPSISIIDNDLIEYERTPLETIAARVHANADWIIAPSSYPINLTINKGANPEHVKTFAGYKENIYVADYTPNPNFLHGLPFQTFIVMRPEALYSTYVHTKKSIIPDLLNLFLKENINIIYLPRHKSDLSYLSRLPRTSNVWVPEHPLNGLDLVYYSKGVLTGSGTFAREAACMGQTAISFFPDKLLAVDAALIKQNKMFHSRDPPDIVDYVLKQQNRHISPSTLNSKQVKREFMETLNNILTKMFE